MRFSLRRTIIGALLMAGFCAQSIAQPVLRNEGMDEWRNGGQFSYQAQNLDTTGLGQRMSNLTTAGRNVTWDFTGLARSGSVVSISNTYVRVEEAGLKEHYPDATHAILDRSSGQDRYMFMRNTSEISEVLGGGTPATGQYHINEGLIHCTFPLNYDEGAEHELVQRTYITGWPDSIAIPGTSSYKYIGYGTLNLPQGAFQNVILLKIGTTISMMGTSSTKITSYSWIQGSFSDAVASLSQTETVMLAPFTEDTIRTYSYSFWHTPNQPSSRENANFVPASLQLHPNPSTGDVWLDFALEQSGKLAIEVSDALGRIVYREEENVIVPGPQSRRLRLEAPAGVYTLRLTGGSGSLAHKLILN